MDTTIESQAMRSLQVRRAQRVLASLVCAVALPALATEAPCITAGRLDSQGRWAPQFTTVRLLDEAGRSLIARSKADLSRVRGVELTEPALLSACDHGRSIARGEATPGTQAPVPAAKPGRLAVQAVGFSPLQVGGELVELQVRVSAEAVTMITR